MPVFQTLSPLFTRYTPLLTYGANWPVSQNVSLSTLSRDIIYGHIQLIIFNIF